MRLTFATLISTLVLSSATATAAHHETKPIDAVLAASARDADRARDEYRHPAETLQFFGISGSMTVGEYGPGGGWYTRVIAPYVADEGTYVAINADVERYNAGDDAERMAERKKFPQQFPARVAEWTGIDAADIVAVELDEAPEMAGKLDAVLTFRGLHGLARKDLTDETLAHFYGLLKPGGIVGVVQHRAKEDAPYDYARGNYGYLKQSEVIAMFESEGFEFVESSEINANPMDAANWEKGVWTLPPTLTLGDTDKEKYLAIGESDRMTLKFRKPE